VLTDGHDAANLDGPVSIGVSADGDQITQMNGQDHAGSLSLIRTPWA